VIGRRISAAALLVAACLAPAALSRLDAVEVRKIRPDQPSDAALMEDLRARMMGRPGLEMRDVRPDVVDGHLTLRGSVDALYERDEAERLCSAIRGLRSITNEIEVRRTEIPDSLLQLHALRALEASPRLRSFGIEVSVTDAVLSMTGEVPLFRDRLEAEKLASRTQGIVGMDDRIRLIQAPVDPEVVERRLKRVLGDKLIFGGVDDLTVQVSEQGVVTLGGVAAAHIDRLKAERIAFGIRGVTAVINRISVRRPRP
jgi:osmotically-inducible protein OsmY